MTKIKYGKRLLRRDLKKMDDEIITYFVNTSTEQAYAVKRWYGSYVAHMIEKDGTIYAARSNPFMLSALLKEKHIMQLSEDGIKIWMLD
jgi:hypothetical protein